MALPVSGITAVGTDSRRVVPGSLFVAIVGPRYDGHDFASASLRARGPLPSWWVPAAASIRRDLVSRCRIREPRCAILPALRRSELAIPVVAVTGSTGKTSTKDLIGHILSGSWVSPSSYNNEIGVPLTVLATPSDSRYLIAEVGSRGTGQIEWLIPAVRPHVAVVTNPRRGTSRDLRHGRDARCRQVGARGRPGARRHGSSTRQ